MSGLNDALDLDHYGASKIPSERGVWAWLREQLDPIAGDLKANRQAALAEVDQRGFEKVLREADIEKNSRRWSEMVKRSENAVRTVNQAVELQQQVEPWLPRHVPDMLIDIPDDLHLTVSPLALALLRPLLAHHLAESVVPEDVARRLEDAARASDDKGRYRLARIADRWCEDTGQEVPALQAVLERHRALSSNLELLKSRPEFDLSDIELHVMDDDLYEAEEALSGLEEQIRRQERLRRTRGQLEGLRQSLEEAEEAGIAESSSLRSDLETFELRVETDDSSLPRDIGAAQQRLNRHLDEMLRERLDELRQRVNLLGSFGVADSVQSEWRARISELDQRPGARGANELHRELEAQVEERRQQVREEAQHRLADIDQMLNEVGDFNQADLGRFANQHSEIESVLGEAELSDVALIDARQRVSALRLDLDEHRIKRWSASEDGESQLVEHLVRFCTGSLDYDESDIRRLHVAVKTKPFVILAGLTGSGKSTLTRLYAAALGATSANGGFRRVAVRVRHKLTRVV